MTGDGVPALSVADAPPKAIRVWRPRGEPRVLAALGRARSYQVEPNGEYYVGHIAAREATFVRGRSRYLVNPGELVVWDPSAPHGGSSTDGGRWEFRGLVLELPSLAEIIDDPSNCVVDVEFPHPVIRNATHVTSFLRLFRTLTEPSSTLERDVAVASWLRGLAPARPRRAEARIAARRDPALLKACALLQDVAADDIGLAELALTVGVSKFRLLRLFKSGLGVPPHRYQVQLRVQRARQLLERGERPIRVAHRVGFYDQSHFTRHFQRRMGMTPSRYAQACTGSDRIGSSRVC